MLSGREYLDVLKAALGVGYPSHEVVGYDLTTGDLTIGPLDVSRQQAVLLNGYSQDGNTWSMSIEWTDGAGSTYRTQSASDLGLSATVQDSARVVRKGSYVVVTVTDESGATTNSVNVFVDAHR